MKFIKWAAWSVLVTLPFSAFAYTNSVIVSSPMANASVTSPVAVAFICDAASPSAYQIYDEVGNLIYNNSSSGTSSVPMTSGPHTLSFKCWYGTNGSSVTQVVSVPINVLSSFPNTISANTPTANQILTSPLAFSLTCNAANPTSYQIYDGTTLAYSASRSSGSLTLTPGAHALAFKCWYANGSAVTPTVSVPITVVTSYSNTISVSSPLANQNVPNPVSFSTACNASNPTSYQIYDGSNLVYNGTIPSGSLTLSTGSHTLAFKCWYGTNGSSVTPVVNVPITVGASNTYGRTQIQTYTDWQSAGNCGNGGGCTGSTPTYGLNQGISSPSLSGNATQFYISGNSGTPLNSYTGGYMFHEWLNQDLPNALITQGVYSFDLYMSSGALSSAQAVEFEFQQKTGGFLYNMAWQADFAGSGHWRIFNYNTQRWEDSGLAISTTGLTSGSYHHIVVHHHLTSSTVYHDWISVDGKVFTLNIQHAATNIGGNAVEFTNGFQLDLDKNNDAFNVDVDNMSLTYWH